MDTKLSSVFSLLLLSFLFFSLVYSTPNIFSSSSNTVVISQLPYTITKPGAYVLGSNEYYKGEGNAVTVKVNNVVLNGNGHTIEGSGKGVGIYGMNVNDIVVKNFKVMNFREGLEIDYNSTNNTFYGNIVSNNKIGVDLGWCSGNNTIYNNTISGNVFGIRAFLEGGVDGIHNNKIEGNKYGIEVNGFPQVVIDANKILNNKYGIELRDSSGHVIRNNEFVNDGLLVILSYNNTVENNYVNGKPLVYLEGVSDYTVDYAGQVVLVDCNNILISNFDLSNASVGVELWKTNNTVIKDNIMSGNTNGTIIWGNSYRDTINGNYITDNKDGVNLELGSYNNSISGNLIKSNEAGIILQRSGVFGYNEIHGNILLNNKYGVVLGDFSGDNIFYGNNFIDNGKQVLINAEQIFPNKWDNGYPSGGNYWSNYHGEDEHSGKYQNETGSDGIGDSIYIIYTGNVDHYPLMNKVPINFTIPETKTITITSTTPITSTESTGSSSTSSTTKTGRSTTTSYTVTGIPKTTPISITGGSTSTSRSATTYTSNSYSTTTHESMVTTREQGASRTTIATIILIAIIIVGMSIAFWKH
ncbi:MAG: right-handed parallel beta-helix repeat-containing protein [Desulfurococcales archaeon]|nr:right-handed parallel beta-helix repeat-containing protein [Desulfurococcales archaeon]